MNIDLSLPPGYPVVVLIDGKPAPAKVIAPFPRHVFVELVTGEELWLRWDEVKEVERICRASS